MLAQPTRQTARVTFRTSPHRPQVSSSRRNSLGHSANAVVTFVAISNMHRWTRIVATAGGAMLSATGVWMVRETLASSHFEGYALVLGSMLVLQGVLTVFTLLRRQAITVDRY